MMTADGASPCQRHFPTLLCLLALGGCAAPEPIFPPVEPPLVWPRFDDTPRYSYVGSLSGEADLKRPRSLWNWIADLFAGADPPAVIRNASDVAVTPSGILYVADPGAQLVHRFDLENREYQALRDAGEGRRFVTPIGLATIGDGVVVSDRSLRTVTLLSRAGEPQSVVGPGGLRAPVGVSVGPLSRRIFVVDVGSHHVLVFGADGEVVMALGGRGDRPGEFNFPTYVACDAEENVYVTDTLNCRVQVFDRQGRFIRAWGKRGTAPGEFSQPKGIATDRAGRIYVVDSHFENVQVFNPQGELLLAVGEEGRGPGQFWLPLGICALADGTIWVADTFNQRVQVFRYLGKTVDQNVP